MELHDHPCIETLKKYRLTSIYCITALLLFSHSLSANTDELETNKDTANTLVREVKEEPSIHQTSFLGRPSKNSIIDIGDTSKKTFSYHFKESSLDEKKIQVNLRFKF